MFRLIGKYHCLFYFLFLSFVSLNAQVMPRVYDIGQLQKIRNLIKENDGDYQVAFSQLINHAEKSLKFDPVSVMEKSEYPPSGNKHDYMSLAPYHWPNPNTKDGLPYVRRDGETNPEVKTFKDKEYLPELCNQVLTLSLASYYSGNIKYANHAVKLIRVWFLDSATKMNPNMNFSQAIRGENTGRGAGVIDGRHFIKIIESIGIMSQASMFPSEDIVMMKSWFFDYLNWMQTSKNGKDEILAPNNHGVWFDALRLSISLFVGQKDLANEVVLNVQKRLSSQMDVNMRFPLEMARTTSLHYSLFALEAFMKVAKMGEFTNNDLWNYSDKNGHSLQKAFDEIAPYLMQNKKWDGQQIKPFDFSEGVEVLYFGYQKYKCLKCFDYLRNGLLSNVGYQEKLLF